MLLLMIENGNPAERRVQAVRLDDPSPGYAAQYAAAVKMYLDPDAVLLYAEVDVSSVAEYGPNDVAAMLTGDESWGVTDLPQVWERA